MRTRSEPFVRAVAAWLTGLLLLAAASGASAQSSEADVATARKLAEQAFAALDAKDYPKAAELFARAEKLYHAPTLLVGLARAQAALGRVVEAQENYKRVLREKLSGDTNDAFRQAAADAAAEIVQVEKQIAWVTIELQGPADAKVLVDGVELPRAAIGVSRATNPGQHAAVARASGCEERQQSFSAEPGGQSVLELKLSCKAGAADGPGAAGANVVGREPDDVDDPGATVRTVGFVSIGVGGAGLLLGTIAGILAMNAHSELVSGCPNGQCPESERDTLEQYQLLHPLSTTGFVVGGVLAATGVVLVLAAPSADSEAATRAASASAGALSVRLGPSSGELTMRF